jgi:hypothetical protein
MKRLWISLFLFIPLHSWAQFEGSSSIASEQFAAKHSNSSIHVAYFNLASMSVKGASEGTAPLGTYNYFSFDYKTGKDTKYSLRPTFYFQTAGLDPFTGREQKEELNMGDIYLQYADYSLALLPGDVGLLGSFRAYLPVSKYSRRSHTITRLQSYFIFNRALGYGYEISYNFKPSYYIQGRTGYLNDNQKVRGTSQADLEHYFSFAKHFSSGWSVTQSLGLDHEWKHAVKVEHVPPFRDETWTISSAVGYNLGFADVSLSVGQSRDLNRPRGDFSLYNPKETEYVMTTIVRL